MPNDVAEHIGAGPNSFAHYAKRQETKTDHVSHLPGYLELRSPTAEDRRAAFSAAIDTALTTDTGKPIATRIILSFRERRALLPAANMIERIGLAARAIARRRAEAALIAGLSLEKLEALDGLLSVDPAIHQTRFFGAC